MGGVLLFYIVLGVGVWGAWHLFWRTAEYIEDALILWSRSNKEGQKRQ